MVFSHWDTQENNVLQTLYGLRFIDFEYSGMDYQAFDIASYFVECMIDHLSYTSVLGVFFAPVPKRVKADRLYCFSHYIYVIGHLFSCP